VKKISQKHPHHIGIEAINNENNIPLYIYYYYNTIKKPPRVRSTVASPSEVGLKMRFFNVTLGMCYLSMGGWEFRDFYNWQFLSEA
jgi:hypothetical protein